MSTKPPASPPCIASELEGEHGEMRPRDPVPDPDLARWRKITRERLLAERAALPLAEREAAAQVIAGRLDALLGDVSGKIISAWWPIKAELDLRFWLEGLAARGARAALPLVVEKGRPLEFRLWDRGTRMERGFWNILVPAEGPFVTPDIALSPVVGWDDANFRLGYGGGYFDRTLARLGSRCRAVGVGLSSAQLATIFPQEWDVPMSAIVTEA